MSSAEPASQGRVGEVLGGRWTLERVLGEGAMAVVYAARDATGRQAAVKLLRPEVAASADVRRRFVREGGAASRIAHPGVVRVLEHAGEDPASGYLVMELLEGETLAARLEHPPPVTEQELLGILEQLLDVLAEAHAQNVIHRDLKPGNVFLTGDGQVKVLDFGVARLVDPDNTAAQTRLGVALGTVAYMAPEQAMGRHDEIDGKTDLFAVGAMMFRILAARRIHEGNSEADLLVKMASVPAPPLASVAKGVKPELCAIVDMALGFSRDARYPDARTMADDVRAVRAGKTPPHASTAAATREKATVLPGKTAARPAPQSAESSGPDALVGKVLADRYRIEALLGAGGMGAVYRAEHVHMRKTVAVKVLHREMTSHAEVVARFEREAVAAARIEHPNVAAARDFGKLDDGSFYLVLEYAEGKSLRQLLKLRRTLEPARALGIARQIAAALAAAHAAGIVHRDLKPENVMLIEGPEEIVKVLDFGIAKLTADDAREAPALTRMGAVFGTPEYMSPEQALGQTVDTRGDLYALGIMLYEMLTGATPFASDETVVVLTRQMTEPPPPLPKSVDQKIAKLVLDLLEKQPEARVQTATELIERIDGLLGGAPAGPVSMSQARAKLASAPASRRELETGATVLGIDAPGSRSMATALSFGRSTIGSSRWWKQRVRLAGRSIPLWSLGILALVPVLLAVLLIGSVLVAPAADDPTAETESSTPFGIGEDSEVVALRKSAMAGDRAALGQLESTPREQRTPADWHVLARGYAIAGEIGASINAYERLLDDKPELAKKPETLLDLRRAAENLGAGDRALQLIAKLGPTGADLLFDAYEDLQKKSPSLAAEAKRLLSTSSVKDNASPALLIAIELREAKGCRAHKELLPRVVEHGDERSAPVLERMSKKTGCGFRRRRDCFSCLRRDETLEQAVAAVEKRAAPRFER